MQTEREREREWGGGQSPRRLDRSDLRNNSSKLEGSPLQKIKNDQGGGEMEDNKYIWVCVVLLSGSIEI